MQDLSRRGFMGTMGMMGAAAAFGATGAAVASADTTTDSEISTPAELEAIGVSTMGLHELNERRKAYVASKNADYVKADGTVVPAAFVQLRALTNTYLVGCGSEVTDDCFDFFSMLFTEDEAKAYLEMPYGVLFTATEFAEQSGRDEDECLALCEDLASRNLLMRIRRNGVPHFHQLALAHGYYEMGLNDYFTGDWTPNYRAAWTADYQTGYMNSGMPFYYPIPVNQDVVAESEIVITDDWKKILERNEVFAVSPCQCRKIGMAIAGEDEPPATCSPELVDFMAPCGHPLETCLSTGDMAQFYIENGLGRQITRDEAEAVLQRSIDAGMILQESFTGDSYVICSCHGDCCRILGVYKAAGEEAFAAANIQCNVSHYALVHDKEACLKCGACMARCPMEAISMDDEGYPQVNGMCMRCGQCAMVCPADARKLEAKDPATYAIKPSTLLDQYNAIAAYRFEHGTIY